MKLFAIAALIVLAGCSSKENTASSDLPIEGTWELISGTTVEKGVATKTDYTRGQRMIKIITPTHFAFMLHDLSNGKDSLANYASGGGPYTLTGDQYKEHLEFCNSREWEGKDFEFTVRMSGDTLIQRGLEKVEAAGIDREITEKYIRVK